MTRRLAVHTTPVNMNAALSLTNGSKYLVEPVAGHHPVRLWESASAPTDLSAFHTIHSGRPWGVSPGAGQGLWIWCSHSAGSSVVVVSDR